MLLSLIKIESFRNGTCIVQYQNNFKVELIKLTISKDKKLIVYLLITFVPLKAISTPLTTTLNAPQIIR